MRRAGKPPPTPPPSPFPLDVDGNMCEINMFSFLRPAVTTRDGPWGEKAVTRVVATTAISSRPGGAAVLRRVSHSGDGGVARASEVPHHSGVSKVQPDEALGGGEKEKVSTHKLLGLVIKGGPRGGRGGRHTQSSHMLHIEPKS